MSQYNQIPLTEKNAKDFIRKIAYLEEHLGGSISYKMLEVEELFPYKDDLSALAKKIAEFVGVKASFIVTRNAKDKGGDIENEGKFSYIDLNQTVCDSFLQTVAVLAHEIMHRFLFSKCLRYSLVIENEVLTDIATVYMGLGKLSLMGHRYEQETVNDSTITRSSHEVGYLDMDSFCFVYLLLCRVRKIDKNTCFYGLSPEVTAALQKIESSALFGRFCRDMEDEDAPLHFAVLFERYNQTLGECSAFINKLDELVKSLNREKDLIQEDLILTSKNVKSIIDQSFTEYNSILRSLNRINQFDSINNSISHCEKAINTLTIKTEQLERLYEGSKCDKKAGKKGLKQKFLNIFK